MHESAVTLRVRDEPFFITNRGLAVLLDGVDPGILHLGQSATATIRDESGATHTEQVTAVEVARVPDSPTGELPVLFFQLERGSEREASLRALFRVGALVTVQGPSLE